MNIPEWMRDSKAILGFSAIFAMMICDPVVWLAKKITKAALKRLQNKFPFDEPVIWIRASDFPVGPCGELTDHRKMGTRPYFHPLHPLARVERWAFSEDYDLRNCRLVVNGPKKKKWPRSSSGSRATLL